MSKLIDQFLNNWKKSAGAYPSDEELETVFVDMAFDFIQDKAKALMKPEHRLGFEIVFRNDEGDRLVGIFAFRIGKRLIYAPVFFLHGEIKGTDLLYRHDVKKFVPHSKEWIELLLKMDDGRLIEGSSIAREEARRNPDQFANKPVNGRQAVKSSAIMAVGTVRRALGNKDENVSEEDIEDNVSEEDIAEVLDILYAEAMRGRDQDFITSAVEDMETQGYRAVDLAPRRDDDEVQPVKLAKQYFLNAFEGFLKHASEIPQVEKLLSTYLVEDGKLPAFDAVINTFEKDANFADNLFSILDPEDYNPKDLPLEEPRTKSASSHEGLVLHMGLKGLSGDEEQFTKRASKGYWFEDNRKIHADVIDCDKAIQGVDMPGSYDIILENEEMHECLVVTLSELGNNDHSDYPKMLCDNDAKKSDTALINLEDGSFCRLNRKDRAEVLGLHKRAPEMLEQDRKWSTKPTPGEICVIYDIKQDKATSPVYIEKVEKTGDGIQKVFYCEASDYFYESYNQSGSQDEDCITIHPDTTESDFKKGVFSKEYVRFLKLNKNPKGSTKESPSYKKGLPPAGIEEVFGFMTDNQFKTAHVVKRNSESDRYQVLIGPDKRPTPDMNRMDTLVYLMGGMHLTEEVADHAITKAASRETGDPFLFFYKAAVSLAYPEPEPNVSVDPNFGFLVNEDQEYEIPTHRGNPAQPGHRIGDAYDPNPGKGIQLDIILSSTPDELANYAKEFNAPQIFDHGVVGSLIKTFDAVSVIDKYLPKMEDALDVMGRIIFLFYWKPKDFEKAFGTDEMEEQEETLLSTFRTYGEMVADLKRRVSSTNTGSIALT